MMYSLSCCGSDLCTQHNTCIHIHVLVCRIWNDPTLGTNYNIHSQVQHCICHWWSSSWKFYGGLSWILRLWAIPVDEVIPPSIKKFSAKTCQKLSSCTFAVHLFCFFLFHFSHDFKKTLHSSFIIILMLMSTLSIEEVFHQCSNFIPGCLFTASLIGEIIPENIAPVPLCLSDSFVALLSSIDCFVEEVIVPLVAVRPRRCWWCGSHSKKTQKEAGNKNLHFGITGVLLSSIERDDLSMSLTWSVCLVGTMPPFIGSSMLTLGVLRSIVLLFQNDFLSI